MDGMTADGEILSGGNRPVVGQELSRDTVIRLVAERFPSKAYCLVEEWTVFRATLGQSDLSKVSAAGHLPLFVFAHKVVQDSRGRFQPGDWVRSSMCVSFDGVMFETKNTVYVLKGSGDEKKASLQTIFSFY